MNSAALNSLLKMLLETTLNSDIVELTLVVCCEKSPRSLFDVLKRTRK